jgi:hypothetical protein
MEEIVIDETSMAVEKKKELRDILNIAQKRVYR